MNIKDFYDNKQVLDNSLKPFYCKSVVKFYSKLSDLDKISSNWICSNIVEFMEALRAKGVTIDETANIVENEEFGIAALLGYIHKSGIVHFLFKDFVAFYAHNVVLFPEVLGELLGGGFVNRCSEQRQA